MVRVDLRAMLIEGVKALLNMLDGRVLVEYFEKFNRLQNIQR